MKGTLQIVAVLAIIGGIFMSFKLKDPPKQNFDVQYSVQCSSCMVHYLDENNVEAETNVTGNWDKSFTGNRDDYVSISATNTNASGTMTVTIKKDGKNAGIDKSFASYEVASTGAILN